MRVKDLIKMLLDFDGELEVNLSVIEPGCAVGQKAEATIVSHIEGEHEVTIHGG